MRHPVGYLVVAVAVLAVTAYFGDFGVGHKSVHTHSAQEVVEMYAVFVYRIVEKFLNHLIEVVWVRNRPCADIRALSLAFVRRYHIDVALGRSIAGSDNEYGERGQVHFVIELETVIVFKFVCKNVLVLYGSRAFDFVDVFFNENWLLVRQTVFMEGVFDNAYRA